MPKKSTAPGALDAVRLFVNTLDVETGKDRLEGLEQLREWLAERGLLAPEERVTREDLQRARAVREALRALLAANAGEDVDAGAVATLDEAASRARLRLRFGADGSSRLEPEAPGVPGALGSLLAIVTSAMASGTWSRLKACRAERCRWAFYDSTRNRSGVWCDMAVCGNREKVRAYRQRRAS